MTWAAVRAHLPYTNFGDALSPFLVAMIANKPLRKAGFQSQVNRIAAVGTIGQNFVGGTVHFWGTGFDGKINPLDRSLGRYAKPPRTNFIVHALRGRKSADLLRSQGVDVPEVFGDPVWFLPRFLPLKNKRKRYELGVIVHLSELVEQTPQGTPKEEYLRYDVPASLKRDVVIINTFAERSIDGLRQKIAQMVSCKRIVSTSLHGLVIAETYGIPCAWFGFPTKGRESVLKIGGDEHIDHRVSDFYTGVGRDTVNAYLWPRTDALKWEEVVAGVDRIWQPLEYDGRALFDAFPVKTELDFDRPKWPIKPELLTGMAV